MVVVVELVVVIGSVMRLADSVRGGAVPVVFLEGVERVGRVGPVLFKAISFGTYCSRFVACGAWAVVG